MIGSTFRGITLMMAFCAADLSDSTAAASTSPVWPSPARRVAMSSQGQRTASCSWGPALMLPAAAAGSGHTYRSGTCPHPAVGSSRRQSSLGFRARGPRKKRSEGLSHRQHCLPDNFSGSRHHRFSSLVPRAQRPLGAQRHILNQQTKKKIS